MNSFLLAICFVVEIAVLVRSARRFGFLPSPTLILGVIVLEQVTLWLIGSQTLTDEFLWTYSTGGVYTAYYKTQFFYVALFTFFYLSHYKLADSAEQERFATRVKISQQRVESLNATAAAAIVCAEVVFSYAVKWSVAWHNGQYLAMADPDVVVAVPRLSFMLTVVLAAGLLSAILSALNFSGERRLWGWAFALLALLPMFYELGAHSRTSAEFPLMFALTLHAASSKRFAAAKAVAVFLTVLFIAGSLVGRIGYEHGLSTVPRTFVSALGDIPRTTTNFLTNVFEGSSVVAESLATPAEFSPTYKSLSLSPTPSFIDGFASIRAASEHRLSYYAPMSGFVEVLDFGPAYLVAFCTIIFLSIRLTFYQARTNYTAFLIANLFLFTGFFTLNTYAARTGLKWFWIADALVFANTAAALWKEMGIARAVARQKVPAGLR